MSPDPKYRVLFVDNSFTFGGAIVSLSHLVRGLDALGVESVVVSGQPGDTLDALFPTARTHSIELHLPWVHDPVGGDEAKEGGNGSRRGLLSRAARSAYWLVRGDLRPALRLARIGKREKVTLVHLNNNGMQTDGALAAKLLRIPCVAHNRDYPETPALSTRWRAALADHHIGVSDAVSEALALHEVPASRRTTVHDAIDLERFPAGAAPPGLRAELGIPGGAGVVGFFGRLIPWKGVLELVEIACVVIAERSDTHVAIVGDVSDGPPEYVERVRRRISDHGLGDRVHLLGFRDDLPALYRLCDVVAHTSIRPEPFGMVVIEAMASGTPVVAADEGGPREIVRDGVDGYLADPTDGRAFAERLLRLLGDEELRARMGREARRRVEARFSKERYAQEVVEVYEGVARDG